ncbi:MAG: hypothetical protein M1814_001205 [Vezdaea aestivalis]|nr:MAG: hypothetical protein M1814_001205 [Vezdaea aestivalis]
MPDILGVPVPQAAYDYQYSHRHESKKAAYLGLLSTFLSCALFSQCLRVWANRIKRDRLRIDDYACLLGTFLYTCNTIVNMLMAIISNAGSHSIVATPKTHKIFLYLEYVGGISYTLTWPMTKIALVLLFLRIFPQIWLRRICYTLLAIFTVYIMGTVFANIFSCTPIRKSFDGSVKGHCIKRIWLVMVTVNCNIVLDLTLLFVVLHPIWKLRITRKQRIGLAFVIGLGAVTCAASIVRLKLSVDGLHPNPTLAYDGFWHITRVLWSNVELALCVMCTTLPCSYPVIDYLAYSRRSAKSSPQTSGDYSPKQGGTSVKTDASSDHPPTHGNEVGVGMKPPVPIAVEMNEVFAPNNGMYAEIKTDATGDRRFDDSPNAESQTRPDQIRVKSEISTKEERC